MQERLKCVKTKEVMNFTTKVLILTDKLNGIFLIKHFFLTTNYLQ